jgi:hypothetical protein
MDKLIECGAPKRTWRLVVAGDSNEERSFRWVLEGEVT